MLKITMILLAIAFVAVPRHARADSDTDKAKAVIAAQIDKLKHGSLDDIRAQFTKRLRERITQDIVDKAKKQADSVTIDDLVASAARSGDGIKIKMKNGRTLTTLVQEDGEWRADTIWFK